MVNCPECETDLDIEEDEVDEGEVVSCPECGSDFKPPFFIRRHEGLPVNKTTGIVRIAIVSALKEWPKPVRDRFILNRRPHSA